MAKKKMALVFTGDEFADGGKAIRTTLKKKDVPASFFLTGTFYANADYRNLIVKLKKDGHYLGAHSDKHLLYADWIKRDSLLVTQEQFKLDLLKNYDRMAGFGIRMKDAEYFLPPYEWYNQTIAVWTNELGLKLINFSPGTHSAADYTFPEMGASYRTTDEIYQSILGKENSDKHGLNGFILLLHIGTDPRRTDKFYYRLGNLINDLKNRGYMFESLRTLFDN